MRYLCHDDPITPLAPPVPGAVLRNVTKWALLGGAWPIMTVALDQMEFEREREAALILKARDGGKTTVSRTVYTKPKNRRTT